MYLIRNIEYSELFEISNSSNTFLTSHHPLKHTIHHIILSTTNTHKHTRQKSQKRRQVTLARCHLHGLLSTHLPPPQHTPSTIPSTAPSTILPYPPETHYSTRSPRTLRLQELRKLSKEQNHRHHSMHTASPHANYQKPHSPMPIRTESRGLQFSGKIQTSGSISV